MAKLMQGILDCRLIPGLKKIYQNSESTFIDSDLTECAINSIGTTPKITLMVVGLNHLIPIGASILKNDTASVIMLDHSFANPLDFVGVQRNIIEMTRKLCFSPDKKVKIRNKL